MEKRLMIKVENASKSFRRWSCNYGLKDIILHPFSLWEQRRKALESLALKDISFSLSSGESLAILGPNGAGKSTLLSLLANIIKPSSGAVESFGRIGLMLELGSGFCHDLSGRENIELNGLLLGESRTNLRQKSEAIIEFSGLREYIDEPLRVYSSGMQTRLGFSIAVHASPDIMLIDEVLAVGDSEFQRKCLDKLREMQQNNVAIVLVTHSLEAARQFCERAIYINHGELLFSGNVNEVIDAIYENNFEY